EPPSRRNPACPRALEAICLRCLEKEPRRRYTTAEALADDLRCFLDGLPVSACRPWWARLSRRGWMNAAAVGVLALMGLGALGVWYANREEDAATVPPPGDQRVITIGIVTAQRGPGSQHAQSIRDGVRLAVKELNEQEGPYRFQVVEFSWPPDPGQAAAAEQQLASRKVDVLIGGASRQERKILIPAVERRQQLLMVPVACPGYETSEAVV